MMISRQHRVSRCRSDQSSLDPTEEKQWSHSHTRSEEERAKECQVVDVMCAVRRVIQRGTAIRELTVEILTREAVGRAKRWATWTFCKGMQTRQDKVLQLL